MKPACKFWSDAGIDGAGKCSLNKFGGIPSHGTCCFLCSEDDGEWRSNLAQELNKAAEPTTGLGNILAAIAQPIAKGIDRVLKTNLTNCKSCSERKRKLNQAFKGDNSESNGNN